MMSKSVKFTFIIFILVLTVAKAQHPSIKPQDVDLTDYQYPYPVQFITLPIQGEVLKMAFMDVRPNIPNGHTLVLLHGKNFNGAYWKQTTKSLSENGYRIIIPDQIGFGKSSKPQAMQYSFQVLSQNTKALLDTLGIKKVCLLGHSMGGMIATRFTLMYPDLIDKLILENPIGLEEWKIKMPYLSVDVWYQRELKQEYNSLKKYQQENYFHGIWKPAYERLLEVPAGWTLSKDYNRIARNSARTYDMIFTQPVCYEFENIKALTLLIIGQLDRTALRTNTANEEINKSLGNYPVLGKLTRDRIKGSKLIEMDSVGHIPHIEAFDKFIQPLLQFLKS